MPGNTSKKRTNVETIDAENPSRKSSRKSVPTQHYSDETPLQASKTLEKLTASKPSVIKIEDTVQPIPKRRADGTLIFLDHPEFRPNLTPREVLQLGSFGGTYFRRITSGVTGETYADQWKEFPEEWFTGLNISREVTSAAYNTTVNKYKASCGGDLHMWESSGWITAVDPYGWFQWYCRFYLGRRCSDDARQISRGNGVMGPKGRWRNNLINKCAAAVSPRKTIEDVLNDKAISAKVRQLLQHWGYSLTKADLESALKKR